MKVRDLIEERPYFMSLTDTLLEGPLYAKHAQNGKRLFDTRSNKKEFVKQFYDWEVSSMWPDFQPEKGISFSQYPYIVPVIGCYIKEPRKEEKHDT